MHVRYQPRSKLPVMTIYLQIFIIISIAMFRLAAGEKNNTTTEKNATTPAGKTVAKRQYFQNDLSEWQNPDIALFQAGLLYSHQTYDPYYEGAFHIAEQLLQQGLILEHHKGVHQPQEIATSPPRNPTKPIYHYTPLPQGTFPAPKPEDLQEMPRDEGHYMHGYNDGRNALHHHLQYIPHFARVAYMPMPAVQYVYYQ